LHGADSPSSSENPAYPGHHRDPVASDETLIGLWLDGRAPNTRRAYEADVRSLLNTVGKPIAAIKLVDVQPWAASLDRLSPASRARRIGAVKSILNFGKRTGMLPFNVGAALRVPAVKNVLAERILEENDLIRLIALEGEPRNHALLRLAFIAGLRISEICALRWRDAKRRAGGGGQITVFRKGGKTRVVMLPVSMWRELVTLRALRGEATNDHPVFRSAKGGALDPSQVHRIVKQAARRAGLPPAVSAHWLRHAHCSHALDRGAPAHLGQATVGQSDLRVTSRYCPASR
jgi:integrase/recombinase XerD